MNAKAKFRRLRAGGQAGLAILAGGLLLSGCASPNVNPATARPGTGYVDFYTESDTALCWQIGKINPANGDVKIVFDDYGYQTNRILRLAFKPGSYQFQVSFLNRAIADPAVEDVTVREGMITPVRVVLTDTGQAYTGNKTAAARGTYYGRYGRGTKIRLDFVGMATVEATAQEPASYQPKEKTRYAVSPAP